MQHDKADLSDSVKGLVECLEVTMVQHPLLSLRNMAFWSLESLLSALQVMNILHHQPACHQTDHACSSHHAVSQHILVTCLLAAKALMHLSKGLIDACQPCCPVQPKSINTVCAFKELCHHVRTD